MVQRGREDVIQRERARHSLVGEAAPLLGVEVEVEVITGCVTLLDATTMAY